VPLSAQMGHLDRFFDVLIIETATYAFGVWLLHFGRALTIIIGDILRFLSQKKVIY
jgi:hypothetical protein